MIKIFTRHTEKLPAILFAMFITSCGLSNVFSQTSPGLSEGKENKEIREQALQLINRPEPKFRTYNSESSNTLTVALSESKRRRFRMKDGKYIYGDQIANKRSQTTIVLLHGVLSSADKMNMAAQMMSKAANANVLAIDLRGHGRSEGTPGDVDEIDQYAEDVAQIVTQVRKDDPKNKVILAGHSMGGGIALRFAMLKDHPPIDGLLLFAPLLGQNAPTLPQPDEAKPVLNEEPFLKIHFERLIGLKMLNSIGDHKFDGLKVLFFNVPPDAPIRSYSYRANESMAPVDYAQGLKAVREPLLVLVGRNDEAFSAGAFESAIKGNSEGEVFVIERTTHNGITQHAESMELIKEWIAAKVANRIQRN